MLHNKLLKKKVLPKSKLLDKRFPNDNEICLQINLAREKINELK